jgi:ketosteroid isomerase-like protein
MMHLEDISVRRSDAKSLWAITFVLVASIIGCHHTWRGNQVLNEQETTHAITELRGAYEAFNRGDIDSAVQILDANVEWIEPVEFPGGGTYHGVDGAKKYLAQSRAGAAQVISTPERFIPVGDRIVVFVHARVLPKESDTWRDVRLADVYTFRGGRVTKMRAFANREHALDWARGNRP